MAKKQAAPQPQSDVSAQIGALIDRLQQAPAAGARTPIGVPSGFVAEGPPTTVPGGFGPGVGPGAPGTRAPSTTVRQFVPPQYFEGDDLTPAGQPPESIVALQQNLVKAGLLKTKYRYGVWDPPSQQAYRQALELANQTGVSDKQAISMYANAPLTGVDTTNRAPLVKKLPNPVDLRFTFETVVKSKVGHGVDPAILDHMVSAYQQAVGKEQQQSYDLAGQDNTGAAAGTVMQAPDASTFAEQQLRRAAPKEVALNDSLHAANLVMQAFGGSGG